MKFVCPESQKRVLLKCGNIASGSANTVEAASALDEAAVSPGPAPGAWARTTPGTSITINHTAARADEVQRIGFRFLCGRSRSRCSDRERECNQKSAFAHVILQTCPTGGPRNAAILHKLPYSKIGLTAHQQSVCCIPKRCARPAADDFGPLFKRLTTP